MDYSRWCLSSFPRNFLVATEINKCDAMVMSLQQSRGCPPMAAIYFTVKFELPAPQLISLEQATL